MKRNAVAIEVESASQIVILWESQATARFCSDSPSAEFGAAFSQIWREPASYCVFPEGDGASCGRTGAGSNGLRGHRENALSAASSKVSILHFATHALLDEKRPELSGIVLSLVDPDGRPLNGFLRFVFHLSMEDQRATDGAEHLPHRARPASGE